MIVDKSSVERQKYEALLAISRLVAKSDISEVLGEILRITIEAIDAYTGSIFLFERGTNLCRHFILQRDLSIEMSQIAVQQVLENGLAGWVMRHQTGDIIEDITTDSRWTTLPNDELSSKVRSALSVPLMFNEEVLGILTLVNEQPHHFNTNDLELAMAIGRQAGLVIHNAYLFESRQEQENRLAAILQNIGQPLLMLRPDFHVLLANHAAATLAEKPLESIQNVHLSKISPNSMWQALNEKLLALGEDLAKQQHTFELYSPDTAQDFSVNVSPVDYQGETVGYVIVFNDLTVMNDLNRLKTHMLRMASHDLKNPLNIAVGYVSLMQSELAEGQPIDPLWMDELLKSLIRMNHLIEELLDEERIERESRFRSADIDILELLDEVISEMKELAARKQQVLVRHFRDEYPPLQGDRSQLRQAMINYISNAIKYTPPKGQIDIEAYVEDRRFHFVVTDNGIGIPKAMQDQIFQPGYRAERDEISQIKGSGVGLSLVAEICRRHHGHVWFESEEGRGSRFGFWVPLHQPRE
ncbi:MAG: hypothetical protein CUN55_00055 [Phototrophicales bacterium]|nr:MAG: hypothetical protein CUN55_00055 [Phototrophicales bacterium]